MLDVALSNNPGGESMETSMTKVSEAAEEYEANAEVDNVKRTMEYLFGPFRFIPARRTLHCGEVPQRIGSRAFDILAILVERPSEPVSKRELINRVWPTSVVEDGNLKVHVSALRRTLGEFEQGSNYIATIIGRGYCFVAPVQANKLTAAHQRRLSQFD
jgi:DNA-binding winged helix-turn-helix (wHTH) protein